MDQSSNHAGSVDVDAPGGRRRLLKAAVAGGVGVAAWSAPNIETLGFAPAYAQVCSAPSPVTTYRTTEGEIGCPGLQNPVRLYEDVYFGPGDAHTAWLSPPYNADGTNAFEHSATGQHCRIMMLELLDENHVLAEQYPLDHANPVAPGIGRGPENRCDWFWRLVIDCVPDGGCFAP